MFKIMNLTTSSYDMERYKDKADVRTFYKSMGYDGVELMRVEPERNDFVDCSDVIGVHFRYFSAWLDFYKGDKDRVLSEFFDMRAACGTYGGDDPQSIVRALSNELEFAKTMHVKYVVFHVSDIGLRESVENRCKHKDKEVIDAAIEIINSALRAGQYEFDFLMENLWWPGLSFLDASMTARLLDGINYTKKGFMMDTGHLLHTNRSLKTQEEGCTYILQRLREHGDMVKYIRGMHLHQTLSGLYVEEHLKHIPEKCSNYNDQLSQTYQHIFKVDAHQPFTSPSVRKIVDLIKPEYCTYEFITTNRAQIAQFTILQDRALGLA